VRLLGSARGEIVAGAVGGLISSTAATISNARRSTSEDLARPLAAGAISAHWASSDPVKATGEPWERKQAFSRTMAELDRRLKIFVNLPLASLDRLSIQSHVDEIGQSKGQD
jgi:hypothetical protein